MTEKTAKRSQLIRGEPRRIRGPKEAGILDYVALTGGGKWVIWRIRLGAMVFLFLWSKEMKSAFRKLRQILTSRMKIGARNNCGCKTVAYWLNEWIDEEIESELFGYS